MLKAIAKEGESNKVALDESFRKFFKKGIVLREFSTATIERYIGDPLFVKHMKSAQLEIIYEYLRNMHLANSYREKTERLRFSKTWLKNIIKVWEDNLKQCNTSIDQVIAPLFLNSY